MQIRGILLQILSTLVILSSKPCRVAPIVIDPCPADYCKNGGSCIGKMACWCQAGWYGKTCEKKDTIARSAGSGYICEEDDCKNGGFCDELQVCNCTTGWEGTTCEEKTDRQKKATFLISEKQYTVNTIHMTSATALKECDRGFGRIITTGPSTIADLRQVFQRTKIVLTQADQKELEGGFWAISGRSFSTEGLCTSSNASMSIAKVSCENTKLPVICVKPTTGPCYSDIAKKNCKVPQDRCQYNKTGLNCECSIGFSKEESNCVDIDECKQGLCMSSTICENLPGSYRCVCRSGMQGDGVICGYVFTMEQIYVNLLNIPISETSSTVSPVTIKTPPTTSAQVKPAYPTLPAVLVDIDLKQIKEKLEDKFTSIFKIVTKSVRKVMVKTISDATKNASVVIDVYAQDPEVTPTTLIEFYKEVARQGQVDYLEGSRMALASAECTPSVLFVGQKNFTFGSALPKQGVWSKEKCPDGRGRASVQCRVITNNDDTKTAYYDISSLKETSCGESVDMILKKVSLSPSIETAETTMADLDSITSDMDNTNNETIWKAVDSMFTLANFVWITEAEITVDTMQSMVNVANNLHRAQKNNKQKNQQSSLLNQTQRHNIVSALALCSTHVQVDPSQTVYIKSEAVNIQVTNTLSIKEGVSFSHNVKSTESASTLRQNTRRNREANVQSFIPQEIIEEAEEIKNEGAAFPKKLAVSFMYFSDAEFFKSDTDLYDVEQVLSIKVAQLELLDLKKPFWFQIPSQNKRRDTNRNQKQYYKCAYLNENTGVWQSDGCTTIPGSNPPNCTCNHMTNFAVLVQTHDQLRDYSLEVVGKVCCIVSIIAISLMLFTHLYFPSLRKSEIIKIHSHLGICLLLTYVLLLSVTERPKPYGHCVASAAALQFFLLSSWGWMVVECVTMYRKLVSVIATQPYHYVTTAAAGVYLSAAIIVLVTLIVSVAWYDTSNYFGWITTGSDFFPSSYVSDRLCWLHSFSLIFGFLIPIGVAFVANLTGAFFIIKAITWGQKEIGEISNKQTDAKTYIIRTITVSVLLGMSWIFSIPLTLSDDAIINSIFGWLFSITNGLQGVFMLVLFCLRREDIRKLIVDELVASFSKSDITTNDKAKEVSKNCEESVTKTTSTAYHNLYKKSAENTEVVIKNSVTEDTVEVKENPLEVHFTRNEDRFLQIGKISTFHPTEN